VEIVQEPLNVNVSQDGLAKIVLNLIVQMIVEVMECVLHQLIVFVHLDGSELRVIFNHVKTTVVTRVFATMEHANVLKVFLEKLVNYLIVLMVAHSMVFVIVIQKNVLVWLTTLEMIVLFQLVLTYVHQMVDAIIQLTCANVKLDGKDLIVVFQFV